MVSFHLIGRAEAPTLFDANGRPKTPGGSDRPKTPGEERPKTPGGSERPKTPKTPEAPIRSTKKEKSLNPVWNEDFELPLPHGALPAMFVAPPPGADGGGGGARPKTPNGGGGGGESPTRKSKKGKGGGGGESPTKKGKKGKAAGGGSEPGLPKKKSSKELKVDTAPPAATLVVTIDDWDLASGNDFMGRRKIPLLAHLSDGRPRRRWFPLGDTTGATPRGNDGGAAGGEGAGGEGGSGEEERGDVQLILRAYFDPARDLDTVLPLPEQDAPDPHPAKPPNELRVTLVRARGLVAMDSAGLFSKARARVGARRGCARYVCGASGSYIYKYIFAYLYIYIYRPIAPRRQESHRSTTDACHGRASHSFSFPRIVVLSLVRSSPEATTSDPRAVLRLTSGSDEVHASTTKWKQLAPVWLERFVLLADEPAADAEARGTALECTIEDVDEVSGNDFMGVVRVPLAPRLADHAPYRAWHKLLSSKGAKDKERGEVRAAA